MTHYEDTSERITSHRAVPDFTRKLQWFRASLLVVLALSSYLSIPLISGGRLLVPSFLTVALAPLLFLTVRRSLSITDKVSLSKIVFVLLLSIALSPGYQYLTEKFLSLAQCFLALAVLLMTVRLMQQVRSHVLERALLVLWLLIVAGSILEVTGVIRDISDGFRTWAYEGIYAIYDSDERDLSFVGWLRPKLFSTEPSHVTKIFIAAINSWLLVRVSGTKVAIVAAATVAMFFIMGSPMLIVSVAITLVILVWNRHARVHARVSMVFAALVIGTLFVAFFGESTLSTLTTRIERIGDTESDEELSRTSENLRVVYPFVTLVDTWSRWPVFGVGIGGKEVVMEHSVFRGVDPKFALGTNATAEFGTLLGLFGGTWFIWLLMKQASQTGVRRVGLMLVIAAMFSQLLGGMETFRYWGFIALFWGALAVADAEPSGHAGYPRFENSRAGIVAGSACGDQRARRFEMISR